VGDSFVTRPLRTRGARPGGLGVTARSRCALQLARSPPADPPSPSRRSPRSTALTVSELEQRGPAETLAGYMSAAAIFLAVAALAVRPLVLALTALVLSLTATAIGGRWGRLHAIAVGAATVGFILGMSIAVVTNRPLF
jgi:hypothetical protein